MVIAGEEITMRRQELGAVDSSMFGVPTRTTVIEDWREQHGPEMPTLHLTLFCTVQGAYIVVIWCTDTNIAEECQRYSLPGALAIEVYGIGQLDVFSEDDAREVTRGLARMVAQADLPWPPEDHIDTEKWHVAERALYARRPIV